MLHPELNWFKCIMDSYFLDDKNQPYAHSFVDFEMQHPLSLIHARNCKTTLFSPRLANIHTVKQWWQYWIMWKYAMIHKLAMCLIVVLFDGYLHTGRNVEKQSAVCVHHFIKEYERTLRIRQATARRNRALRVIY